MGTRHLIAVHAGGEYKIAQYGQWDGYPSVQGLGVLGFCRTMDRAAFTEKVKAATFLTKANAERINAELKAANTGSHRHPLMEKGGKYQQFSRDRGAEILQIVADHEPGILLKDSISFAADSLFCEWAYVIDLDAGTLEVFRGFNQEPLAEGDRFHGWAEKYPGEDPAAGYHPVRHVKTYALDALPTDEQFKADLKHRDDSED